MARLQIYIFQKIIILTPTGCTSIPDTNLKELVQTHRLAVLNKTASLLSTPAIYLGRREVPVLWPTDYKSGGFHACLPSSYNNSLEQLTEFIFIFIITVLLERCTQVKSERNTAPVHPPRGIWCVLLPGTNVFTNQEVLLWDLVSTVFIRVSLRRNNWLNHWLNNELNLQLLPLLMRLGWTKVPTSCRRGWFSWWQDFRSWSDLGGHLELLHWHRLSQKIPRFLEALCQESGIKTIEIIYYIEAKV